MGEIWVFLAGKVLLIIFMSVWRWLSILWRSRFDDDFPCKVHGVFGLEGQPFHAFHGDVVSPAVIELHARWDVCHEERHAIVVERGTPLSH